MIISNNLTVATMGINKILEKHSSKGLKITFTGREAYSYEMEAGDVVDFTINQIIKKKGGKRK